MLSSGHPCITPGPAGIALGEVEIFTLERGAADQSFIHFFQSTAELALLPSEGLPGAEGDHTKVCDGKTCAGLA